MTVSNGGGATAPTKRITHPIGAYDGDNPTTLTFADSQQRIPIVLPVTPTRWRLRIGNYSANNNGALIQGTAVSTLVGVAVGPIFINPNLSSDAFNRWNGVDAKFNSTPLTVPGQSGTIPAGAAPAELVTAWVPDGGTYFKAGIMSGLSLGITSDNVGTVASLTRHGGTNAWSMQWVTAGAAAAFAATNPPAAGITANLSLDIRLEYECQTTRRTLLAIGDSITIGWPGPTITSCQPHEAWPGVAGLQNNCPWVNMGAGGTSTVDWTTFTGWRWQRVDLATSPPDVAIIALGTNDFVGAVTPGTALTNVCNTAKQLLSIGVAEVWGASVLPRGLTAGNETNRVTFNNNLAELPAGFVRYIDFDKALTAGIGGSAGAPNADPDFISTPAANPHPQNRGYQRMGSMIML